MRLKLVYLYLINLLNTSFSFSFIYVRSFIFILFIDACLTDDEPLVRFLKMVSVSHNLKLLICNSKI